MQRPFYSLAIKYPSAESRIFQNKHSGRPVLHTLSQPPSWALPTVLFLRGPCAWVPTFVGREHL